MERFLKMMSHEYSVYSTILKTYSSRLLLSSRNRKWWIIIQMMDQAHSS